MILTKIKDKIINNIKEKWEQNKDKILEEKFGIKKPLQIYCLLHDIYFICDTMFDIHSNGYQNKDIILIRETDTYEIQFKKTKDKLFLAKLNTRTYLDEAGYEFTVILHGDICSFRGITKRNEIVDLTINNNYTAEQILDKIIQMGTYMFPCKQECTDHIKQIYDEVLFTKEQIRKLQEMR